MFSYSNSLNLSLTQIFGHITSNYILVLFFVNGENILFSFNEVNKCQLFAQAETINTISSYKLFFICKKNVPEFA